jgi:hypothetical protein
MFTDQLTISKCTIPGISKLCTLLSIDPYEDIRVLVLLWKLGATKKPAEIQRDEFVTGSCNMNFDSVDKLKELVPSLDTGFLDMDEFKDFYKVREFGCSLTEVVKCCVVCTNRV